MPPFSSASRRVSGGLAGAVVAVALALAGWNLYLRLAGPSLDDEQRGRLPKFNAQEAAWGFDLRDLQVDPSLVFGTGEPRDGIPALNDPLCVAPNELNRRIADALPTTWIAGIVVGGQARAYPEGLLAAHQCINDTLGGEPIAVAYHAPSDSLSAFYRKAGGETLSFANSGLMLESTPLFFDRRSDPHLESLWSPVLLKAISGRAAKAGEELTAIDVGRHAWRDWIVEHPETTVASFDSGFDLDYRPGSAARYKQLAGLPYGAPRGGSRRHLQLDSRSLVLLLRAGGEERAYPLEAMPLDRPVPDRIGDVPLRLRTRSFNGIWAMDVEAPLEAPVVRRTMDYFVWDALFPRGEMFDPASPDARKVSIDR